MMESMNSALPVIMAGISLTVIVVLLYIVIRQYRQLQKLKASAKPKYGFLGKPLYSMLVVGVLVAGFGITYFASRGTPDVDVIADFELKIELQTRVLIISEKGTLLEFTILPILDDRVWGTGEEALDVFWTVTKGEDAFTEFDIGVTRSNPGGFQKLLSSGEYELRADVIFRGRRFSASRLLNI